MKVSDDERAQIEAALRDGQTGGQTARRFGRSISTIVGIAQRAGIALDQSATRKAVAAKRDYNQAERLLLLNRFFQKAGTMLPLTESTLSFQQLTTALAILIDKRRLEDGEATSRSEVHDNGDAKEQLAARIVDLAARRHSA